MKHIGTWLLVAVGASMPALPVGARERREAHCDDTAYHYRHVALSEHLPEGYDVEFVDLIDSGKVYGNAWSCGGSDGLCSSFAAVRNRRGELRVFDDRERYVAVANNHELLGGAVPTPDGHFQAALFRGTHVEELPRQVGEVDSFVDQLTDSGIALVTWYDGEFQEFNYLSRRGKVIPLDLPEYRHVFVNDRGIVAGTDNASWTGFRIDPFTSEREVLSPTPLEPYAWAQGINRRGEVLGYSFFWGGLERIGVWRRDGSFETYFVEGTPQFPTISNRLLWNGNGLIVITQASSDFLVPSPDVRLKIDDLVDEDSGYRALGWTSIIDINDDGDLLGLGDRVDDTGVVQTEYFMLVRD